MTYTRFGLFNPAPSTPETGINILQTNLFSLAVKIKEIAISDSDHECCRQLTVWSNPIETTDLTENKVNKYLAEVKLNNPHLNSLIDDYFKQKEKEVATVTKYSDMLLRNNTL